MCRQIPVGSRRPAVLNTDQARRVAPGESRLRFVENQDDSRRTDAAPPHDGWVTLPPGEYNDELADFIQWIANAKPEDARTIRAEIKRYYYDVGDANGGDALNAILSAVLQPGITKEERQTNLNLAAHYAKYDPALAGRLRDLLSEHFLLLSPWLFRGPLPKLPAVPPEIEFETAAIAVPARGAAIWKLGPFPRGKVIAKLFRSGDLHELSRTIDDFVDNIAISNKSVDLGSAATYQDFQPNTTSSTSTSPNLKHIQAQDGEATLSYRLRLVGKCCA